jgi:cytochrome c2
MHKIVLLLIATLLLASCTAAPPQGDPAQGARLFYAEQIGEAPGCKTCHSVAPGEVIVGPSLAGIAYRAGSRESGVTAEDYIRQSIIEPNAYTVDGFSTGVMYQKFSEELSEEQLRDLIAFLLSLEE